MLSLNFVLLNANFTTSSSHIKPWFSFSYLLRVLPHHIDQLPTLFLMVLECFASCLRTIRSATMCMSCGSWPWPHNVPVAPAPVKEHVIHLTSNPDFFPDYRKVRCCCASQPKILSCRPFHFGFFLRAPQPGQALGGHLNLPILQFSFAFPTSSLLPSKKTN